jgi:hypothetical protein
LHVSLQVRAAVTMLIDCRQGRRCARLLSPRMQERHSTASTCFGSPRIAFRKSIRRPAVCSPRSRRPAATTRGSPGPKGRSGWGSIGTGRSIKSIPKQGRFFASSSPTASSPGSPGPYVELWHRAWEGDESDLRPSRSANGRGPGEAPDAARNGRVGARIRWRRSLLLRRRKEREGEGRPPAQARLQANLRGGRGSESPIDATGDRSRDCESTHRS